MNLIPLVWIAGLVSLAVVGSFSRSFPLDQSIECVYQMADLDAPAADILFLGSSRTGRGIDPVYVQDRLATEHGMDSSVERIALPGSFAQQYRPVLQSYLDVRGAPDVLFLQVLYNFRPERQSHIDIPINPGQNLAFATLGEVVDIHRTAVLNPGDALVPRWLDREYLNLPASLLARFELTVFAALKLPVHMVQGRRTACKDEIMFRHNHPIRLFGDLSDDIEFVPETTQQRTKRAANEKVTDGYLPIDPSAPWRAFENQQMQKVIDIATQAGSTVVLYYLPALGEEHFPETVEQDFATLFPQTPLIHPMSLYDGPQAKEIAVSYYDTHHFDKYGALLVSRYFSDRVAEILP